MNSNLPGYGSFPISQESVGQLGAPSRSACVAQGGIARGFPTSNMRRRRRGLYSELSSITARTNAPSFASGLLTYLPSAEGTRYVGTESQEIVHEENIAPSQASRAGPSRAEDYVRAAYKTKRRSHICLFQLGGICSRGYVRIGCQRQLLRVERRLSIVRLASSLERQETNSPSRSFRNRARQKKNRARSVHSASFTRWGANWLRHSNKRPAPDDDHPVQGIEGRRVRRKLSETSSDR